MESVYTWLKAKGEAVAASADDDASTAAAAAAAHTAVRIPTSEKRDGCSGRSASRGVWKLQTIASCGPTYLLLQGRPATTRRESDIIKLARLYDTTSV
jgi:hypothetical protein